MTKKSLDEMINASGVDKLKHCEGYAQALLAGLNKRFNHFESDEQCILASAFHPKFRQLSWLRQEKREGLKKKMQDLVAAKLKKKVEEADLTLPVDNDSADAGTSAETEVTGVVQNRTDDLFAHMDDILDEPTHRGRRNLIDVNAEEIVTTWMATKRSDELKDEDFQFKPVLMELFRQYNTPVPSSAGVEIDQIVAIKEQTLSALSSTVLTAKYKGKLFPEANFIANIFAPRTPMISGMPAIVSIDKRIDKLN